MTDQTTTETAEVAGREYAGRWIECGACVNGLVDMWGSPSECRYCDGGGKMWRYPSGALALYPGGPFCGRDVRA